VTVVTLQFFFSKYFICGFFTIHFFQMEGSMFKKFKFLLVGLTPVFLFYLSCSNPGNIVSTEDSTQITDVGAVLTGTAFASSSQTANPVNYVNDGKTSTRWCAAKSSLPQWCAIDLGISKSITGTEIMWEQDKNFAYVYTIETTSDTSSAGKWTTQISKTASKQTCTDNFPAITAQFVRVTVTAAPKKVWASIFEFRVNGASVTNYTVTFNKNDAAATGTMTSQTIASGSTAALAANTFVKTGYSFAGWATSAAGAVAYANGASYTMGAANVTLYAKWTAASYTITYNLNGGTNNASNPATYTSASATITLANPTKSANTFGGWFTNVGLTGTAVTSIPAGSTGNQTFWAKWTPIQTYFVSYNANGGSNAPVDGNAYSLGAMATVLNPGSMTRLGYTFTGWNSKADGTGTSYTAGGSMVINGNVMLYAQWQVRDIDGNIYTTVTIGNQVWTVENLKTTHYNNGNNISSTGLPTTDYTYWCTDDGLAKYCNFLNNPANFSTYGYLYNWYAASNPALAPTGWRIPTQADWETLRSYLIANGYNGTTTGNKIAKSMAAQTNWQITYGATGTIGDGTPNNRSGFTALPGGYRDGESGRNFQDIQYTGYWWSSTQDFDVFHGYAVTLFDDMELMSGGDENKKSGFSVKLIRSY
jgi:uncharacterized protein (TIGR02145 family)/uncharacterized repeat protein (TIGR02543 family)